ncbi:interleukin-6 receptor subunit beta [Morone saxatilis]|uniref:interleukin-6 receptor subunit beta n=1 Tax=Morone saxatilis TaxID=34816 RepID=UPI0015E1BE57|nr:interleukin-6 receptor subunit beta [Morone saxatilis]
MEWSLAVVWTYLLVAGLTLAFSTTTSKTGPRPPRLIDCVFQQSANVTCRWEAGDTPATHYTLVVRTLNNNRQFTCTTTDTSCTAITNYTVRVDFCITVTAHSHSRDISSDRPCQSGRIEVMLNPVPLNSVKPVRGRPQCLNVTWVHITSVFPVSLREIYDGNLKSQIEFTAEGKLNVQVENATVKNTSFLVCLFRPDTLYTIRLRHSFKGPQSPWSPWSNARQGRTGEDAPSAAPAFWRRVKQTDKNDWRLVSLLWKPLPRFLASGRVLFFNVTCQTESAQILNDHGSCRDLPHTSTSCSLRLPAGRCSCALTASTSAGTSPEARIWLPGASETELPPPEQITASPLDDNSLDVRWTAPANQSPSGFVVEWFAVGQNSSILHWERLNSSCTSLVITEGVKPMKRYVVSVKALYGEQGAGPNMTVHNYTCQGVPSAYPAVETPKIIGSTVKLVWSPVPEELLHGFIRNYIVSYSKANQTAKRVPLRGDLHSYSLENLSPGHYNISVQANTDAGAGPAWICHVYISSEEISIVMCVLLPLLLTSLALVLMVCLTQNKMVKQKLCQDVPDPSKSSLALWKQKIALESMRRPATEEKTEIKYSEVILLSESELQDPDKDINYQSFRKLQTYSTPCCSPLPVSRETPQNTRKLEVGCNKSSTGAKTTSNTDLSSSISIYSNILFTQTPKSLPAPHLQSIDWQQSAVSVNGVKQQAGGGREPSLFLQGRSAATSDSPLSQTDQLKNLHQLLRQHQNPASFSDFNSISHSSVFPYHPAQVVLPQNPFSQNLCNSVPSLQHDAYPRTDALSDSLTTSLSTFPQTLFVDFSYCPVECNP